MTTQKKQDYHLLSAYTGMVMGIVLTDIASLLVSLFTGDIGHAVIMTAFAALMLYALIMGMRSEIEKEDTGHERA